MVKYRRVCGKIQEDMHVDRARILVWVGKGREVGLLHDNHCCHRYDTEYQRQSCGW